MNKKIKVIDLFNIIANEEELPQTIIYQGIIYNYTKNEYGEGYLYIDEDDDYNWLANDIWCDDKEVLNNDIEILEDNTEEIEELDRNLKFDDLITPYGKNEDMMWTEIIKQHNKIDEIIRYIKRKDKSND